METVALAQNIFPVVLIPLLGAVLGQLKQFSLWAGSGRYLSKGSSYICYTF